MRTYSELVKLPTYVERFEYLKLNGSVAKETFGFDRYLNQILYNSREWKNVRREVIIRDQACDLGIEGYDILERPLIHHMNPINMEDILNRNPDIFNPEFLITVSFNTHNAIHYGDKSLLILEPVIRRPGDTKLW